MMIALTQKKNSPSPFQQDCDLQRLRYKGLRTAVALSTASRCSHCDVVYVGAEKFNRVGGGVVHVLFLKKYQT